MCTLSYVGDLWGKTVPQQYPWVFPVSPNTSTAPTVTAPSRAEFDALKREVEALREALRAAKAYDEATGQPDCEMEEKVELIRRVADLVGVDLSDVFPESCPTAATS